MKTNIQYNVKNNKLKRLRFLIVTLVSLLLNCNQYGILGNLEQVAKGTFGYSVFMPDALAQSTFLNQVAVWFGDAACGNITGIAKADCGCTYTAKKLGIYDGREFRAWISDSNVDAICNVQGIAGKNCDNIPEVGPFISAPECSGLESGCNPKSARLIAKNVHDLLNTNLISQIAPIDLTNATYYQSGAWTGTGSDGRSSGSNCLNWNTVNGVENGTVGNLLLTEPGKWTNSGPGSCNNSTGFICIEKVENN